MINNIIEQREEVNKAVCLKICVFLQNKEFILSGYVKKKKKHYYHTFKMEIDLHS